MTRSQRVRLTHTWGVLGLSVLLVGCAVLVQAPWWVIGVAIVVAIVASVASARARTTVVSHWEAQARHVSDGTPIVYWRPWCGACIALRWDLRRRSVAASWVDIWSDDAGAAFVRDVNGGHETVPTVILRTGEAVTHPDPHQVK